MAPASWDIAVKRVKCDDGTLEGPRPVQHVLAPADPREQEKKQTRK